MAMVNSQLAKHIENWNRSGDFPELPSNPIARPHLLRAVIDVLNADAQILFIEGEAGDGATCTLAQFCDAYADQTFSLFIKPASKLTYSLDYLRLVLAEQFHWYVYGEPLRKDKLTRIEYEDLLIKLSRKDRSKSLYFVVDGLHQIPAEDKSVIKQIFLELLPTGAARCRFIVTGHQAEMAGYFHSSVKSRYYQLLKFSLEECKSLLSDTNISAIECEKVYELCKGGSPGRLSVVRRLLQTGTSLSDITDRDPARYLEFVKLEFESLFALSPAEKLVIANVAYSKVAQSRPDLCAVSEVDDKLLEQLVGKCAFLRQSGAGHVEFISETHRQVAARQLESLKRSALEAQLAFLQGHPHSEAALRFLPSYLETLNRQEAIFELLSTEHYGNLLQTTQSFSALKAQAAMAAKSAVSLRRTQEVFKFSLHKSIFSSVSSASGSPARVKALVSLGKTNMAMALANAEATKEDRLMLLCAFARRVVERNGKVEPELLAFVGRLVQEVDFGAMGDKAIDIAADVLIFDPDTAISIIESAVKGATAATKDAAYAELSFSASVAKLTHRAKIEDKARPLITDEALQRIAYSFELVAGRVDTSELLSLLTKMPAAHQVYFLRSFVSIKRRDPRVLDLVELGLDTIIKESEYTPRAKDLAELCAPFLFAISDHLRLKKLVMRVESQLGLVGRATQSRDLTTLQMRLAAAEYQYDKEAARNRLTETYFAAMEIQTPEVKLECLAVMLGALPKIDVDEELERADGFLALIRDELGKLLDRILNDTADHLGAVLPVLKAIAVADCEEALVLAGRMNVEHRRDTAYQAVAATLVGQPFSESRLTAVKVALANITSPSTKSHATANLLNYLENNQDKSKWVARLDAVRNLVLYCYEMSAWDCWMLKASRSAGCAYSESLFVDRTNATLQRASSSVEEADVNFFAAEALADIDTVRAEQFYAEGLRTSNSTAFGTKSRAKLFETCLSLVGRSMASLARVNLLDDDKVTRYARLVDKLPDVLAKTRVFNEFAERLWCSKRVDLTKQVVSEYLRPLIEQARNVHPFVGHIAAGMAFPSMCLAHQKLALRMLLDLPDDESDRALHAAALVRMRHLCGQEPDVNGKFDHNRLEAEDVFDVVELLENLRIDSTIHSVMKSLVDAINDKSNKSKFTTTQKADWSAKLRAVVDEKLPDPKNIAHAGYQIVCTALVHSLVQTTWPQWEALIVQTRAIPNVADRSYIYCLLAETLPTRFSAAHRKPLLDDAFAEINRIPSPIDRLSHMQSYAQAAHAKDSVGSARECLKAAMKLSLELENHSRIAQHRRELIDIADQIDPGLADELIEMVDDDPARMDLKTETKQVAALAKAKRDMANAKQLKDASDCDIDLLPAAAWRNLAALEAGRLEVKLPEVTIEYVSQIASGSLHEAYPVLSWHLANMERKYLGSVDAQIQLAPLCEVLLLSAELTESILCRVAGKGADVREESSPDGLVVTRQSRDEAVAHIENWLRTKAKVGIIYCDPYFSTKDIQFLRLCLANAPECKLTIIASKPHLVKQNELGEGPFLQAWREQSDQAPPETEVIATAYVEHPQKNVIHDRWLLTEGAGLRLGTSFSSLGEGKLSEISEIDTGRVGDIAEQLGRYIAKQRIVDAARIHYSTFTL